MSKKKIITIVSSSIALALIIALVVCIIVIPVTYSVDESLVKKNNEYSVKIVEGQKYTTLTKTYEGEDDVFKIIGFTDLHFDTYKDEGGNNTMNMMIRNIVNQKPDLIVFGGDIITSSFNLRRTKQFCNVLEELGVYWTLCLGNHEHDNNFSITREKMIKTFTKYDHCLIDASIKYTKDGTKVWGNGNHVINILNSDGKICQSLYLLDSGQDLPEEEWDKYMDGIYPEDAKSDYADGAKEHDYSYDYIKDNQITWYKETVDDINTMNGAPVLSTLFMHIPVHEVEEAWMSITGERYRVFDSYNDTAYDYSKTSGDRLLYGERREFVCHSAYNSGLFDACLEKGTQAMFFGHDHVNDCIMEYKGITLGYIKAGGYTTYNTLSKKYSKIVDGVEVKASIEDHLTYGFTVFEYKKDGSMTVNSYDNCDLYPELDETLRAELKKK